MGERVLHCWKDYTEHLEEIHGWGTPAYWVAWAAQWSDEDTFHGSTCMLEDSHDGPHDFTPDSDIGVSFAEEGWVNDPGRAPPSVRGGQ